MPAASPLASLAGPALRLQTDARLVTLSREGHDRAFEEIVRRYRSPLISFAASIVPADRAEDVVQEALERAHTAIATSDAELAVRPWLYRVVRNRALNDLRDHRSHEELDPEYDGVPQPPDIAARSAELAATVAAINALPSAQRDAIVKRELEGRGHEEIAADLGVSAGAVRQLIFRARTTLRNAIGSLVPLPAMRALLEADSAGAGAAGAGAGAAALGVAGGGGGVALKAGTAVVIAGLAIGSGVALHGDRDHSSIATAASQDDNAKAGDSAHRAQAATGADPGPRSGSAGGSAGGDRGGSSPDGGDRSGPGGGSEAEHEHSEAERGGHSGPGGGGDDEHGNPGPGGGGGGGGDDNSGPGGGGEPGGGGDHSGPGGGGVDHSGPGGGGGEPPADEPPDPPEDEDLLRAEGPDG